MGRENDDGGPQRSRREDMVRARGGWGGGWREAAGSRRRRRRRHTGEAGRFAPPGLQSAAPVAGCRRELTSGRGRGRGADDRQGGCRRAASPGRCQWVEVLQFVAGGRAHAPPRRWLASIRDLTRPGAGAGPFRCDLPHVQRLPLSSGWVWVRGAIRASVVAGLFPPFLALDLSSLCPLLSSRPALHACPPRHPISTVLPTDSRGLRPPSLNSLVPFARLPRCSTARPAVCLRQNALALCIPGCGHTEYVYVYTRAPLRRGHHHLCTVSQSLTPTVLSAPCLAVSAVLALPTVIRDIAAPSTRSQSTAPRAS